jgi:hypothetical protein
VVYTAVKDQLRCALFDLLRADPVQKRHRVMIYFPPEMRIQIRKKPDNLRVPCPPQILCQRPKPLMKVIS